MKKATTILMLLLLIVSCKDHQKKKDMKKESKSEKKYSFDLQGHRGARGLFPENTLPSFKKALEIGVNTVELDVVITKDKKVLVSHEPWLNPAICLDAFGNKIEKEDAMNHNIYDCTYEEIQKIDCGSIGNPDFPEQQKMKATKPLLSDVIDLVETFSKENNISVAYNIEIKSDVKGDDLYHPLPEVFSDLVVEVLKSKNIKDKATIQSFDVRVLQYLHKAYPSYKLAYLVYKDDVKTNLEKLGFIPPIYSPAYKLLNKAVVGEIHQKNMKVIPWTVNDVAEMKKLLDWGVDGIITDYPDKGKFYK